MRLAVISDIHGNLAALDAVLDDLSRRAVDLVVVGGDLVNRGPQPAEVVRRVRDLGYPTVKGNHERYILAAAAARDNPRGGDDYAPARWAADQLSADALAYLNNLPFSISVEGLLVVHASPLGDQDCIFPRTTDAELAEKLRGHPTVVCAHTHVSLVRHWDGGLVVNAGSAGNTFEGDTLARYALLERRRDGWRAEIIRVPYDLDATLRAFETGDYLDTAGPMARLFRLEISTGRNHLIPAYLESRAAVDAEAITLSDAVARYLDAHYPS